MRAAASSTGAGPYDQLEKKQLQVIVEQLQVGYDHGDFSFCFIIKAIMVFRIICLNAYKGAPNTAALFCSDPPKSDGTGNTFRGGVGSSDYF